MSLCGVFWFTVLNFKSPGGFRWKWGPKNLIYCINDNIVELDESDLFEDVDQEVC